MRRLILGLLAAVTLSCAPKQPAPPVAERPAAPMEPPPEVAKVAEPESEPPVQEAEPPVQEPKPPAEPLRSLVPAGFVSEPASEATCDRLAKTALKALSSLDGPCTTAHDCEVVRSACPLGCFQVISKLANASKAQKAVDAYFARCRPCKDKCVPPPKAVACAQERCFASP
jgi:hypothetical protein